MNLTCLTRIALDQMLTYKAKYCRCVQHFQIGPWCDRWNNAPFSFCVLSGGLDAKFCLGARLDIDFYITMHPSICNKTKSKIIHDY